MLLEGPYPMRAAPHPSSGQDRPLFVPMMVNVGDVIENPVTWELHVRADERTDRWCARGVGPRVEPHGLLGSGDHRSQEEKFQVLEGRIVLRCRGEESMNGPGETVVCAGAPLAWADGGAAARVRITFTPGAGIEQFFDEFSACPGSRQGDALARSPPAGAHDCTRSAGSAACASAGQTDCARSGS